MQIGILERPRTGAVTGVAVERTGRGLRVAVAGGVLAVLAGALWSLHAVSGAVSPAGPGELGLVGGVVHVDGVVSAARAQHAMPGMGTDDDPVAEDERRVSVDVTLRADDDSTLAHVPERFRLTVADRPAEAPHKLVLPAEELPPGTSLSGTLVFDVPEDATSAVLAYDGSRTTVSLPEEAAGPAAAGPARAAEPHGADHG